MMSKIRSSWLILCLATALSGCVATAVGAVAITTIDVIHDRRTIGEYIDDSAIELKLRQYFLTQKDLRQNAHLSATSMNGVVLLTGEAPTTDLKAKIVAHAKDIKGVKQVIDEVRLAGKTALASRATDSWITAKVKSRLLQKTKLDATRIKVVSEHGTVYLMGLVSRPEAEAATEIARDVSGVTGVTKVFEYLD